MTALGQMLVNEGIEKGIEKGLVRMVCRKMKKGKSLERIAEELDEDMSVITPIYEAASRFSPDYDSDLVYKQMAICDLHVYGVL